MKEDELAWHKRPQNEGMGTSDDSEWNNYRSTSIKTSYHGKKDLKMKIWGLQTTQIGTITDYFNKGQTEWNWN
jgi:hypothetical protein